MSGGIGQLVLSGPLILAAPVAAAAGALTFASPCVLPLVPGYLSYVTGMSGSAAERASSAGGQPQAVGGAGADASGSAGSGGGGVVTTTPPTTAAARKPRARTVVGASLFVLGFSLVFALYGGASGGLGSLLQTHSAGLTQILGGLTIVLGLLFAGVFDRFPITGRIMRPSIRPRAGLAGAPVLGAMFGLSWTPCIGPTLAVVITLSYSTGGALRGAILMFIYGLGLGIPFLFAAALFQRGVTAFGFARRHARLITGVGGAMLVLVGALEVSGAWTAAMGWLKTHWISGYSAPL